MLGEVDAQFPSSARWTRWCYGGESSLFFNGHVLKSTTSVQQGDPLGPLLFATTVQRLVNALKRSLNLTVLYLDDGVLAGEASALAAALQLIEGDCAGTALRVNL